MNRTAGDVVGVGLEKLGQIKFGPQLRESLLDLCRKFDALDLAECNRRLAAGEPLDADCDATMEKRQALGEQIKESWAPLRGSILSIT